MPLSHTVDQQFSQIDFTKTPLPGGEYELCAFIDCDLTKADLSHRIFYDCTFINCTLTGAKLNSTAFRDVQFSRCRLDGLLFENCNAFLLATGFAHCRLSRASFRGLNLKNTVFAHSILNDADFAGADLSGATFDECELQQAVFDQTNLERTDFRTAHHYALDPERNRLKGARFAWPGVTGLLTKYGISIE